jgi:hypothetical protein
MARRAKQGEWKAEAAELFEQLLAANEAVNNAVILLAGGERDKAILAPVYDPARAMRISASEAAKRFRERYQPRNAKLKDSASSVATAWAFWNMTRALSDNFAIARVLTRLRHNEEEIPVNQEDLQELASMHESVNMIFALCGSTFSRYRNAPMGAMGEFMDAAKKVDELVDLQLGEIERVLHEALGE